MHWRRILGFILLALIWGTTWLAIRVVVSEAPPLSAAAVRFLVASLLLGLFVRWRRLPLGWSSHRPSDRRLMLLLALLMIAIPYSLVFWAEQFIESGLAAVLFATHTMFVVLAESVRLRESVLGPRMGLGILLALGGVAVIFWPRLHVPEEWVGVVAMLGAAASSAVAIVVAKHRASHLHPMVSVTWQMTGGAIVLCAVAGLSEGWPDSGWSLKVSLALGYLAVFGSCVTFVLYYWLLKQLATVRLSTLAFITPVVAVVSGWALLSEKLGGFTLLGAALALSGVAVLHHGQVEPELSGDSV